MTELETRILMLFQKLDRKGQQAAMNMATLMVSCPGFSAALNVATPVGEKTPPWEVTEQLVAEWMAKEGVQR